MYTDSRDCRSRKPALPPRIFDRTSRRGDRQPPRVNLFNRNSAAARAGDDFERQLAGGDRAPDSLHAASAELSSAPNVNMRGVAVLSEQRHKDGDDVLV